jgi:hypothetical protein
MMKFLIGPALVGTGYVAGTYYGADSEQLVHKSPGVTYAAVEQSLGNVRQQGMTFFDGGTPMPYTMTVDRSDDARLVVTLFFDGKQGVQADVRFAPRNDGQDTMITSTIHADRNVLRTALAGTSKARLAYAPDWMLNLAFRPVLRQVAQQIEQGAPADLGMSEDGARAAWEGNLSDEDRARVADWQQYEATKPAVDPNAAARNSGDGS